MHDVSKVNEYLNIDQNNYISKLIIEQLDLTIFFQFVNCETDSSDLKIRLDEPHYKITKLL